MSKIRRINFWGGPGCKKSTSSAKLFSDLKILFPKMKIELCRELIKDAAWEGKNIDDADNLKYGIDQWHYEQNLLKYVDLIISDSPVGLASFYTKNRDNKRFLFHLADSHNEKFKSLDICLLRGNIPYNEAGRYQTEEEATTLDNPIYDLAFNLTQNSKHYKFSEYEDILKYCKEQILC